MDPHAQPTTSPNDRPDVVDVEPKPASTSGEPKGKKSSGVDAPSAMRRVIRRWIERIPGLAPQVSPVLAQQNGIHDLDSPLRARWVLRIILMGLVVLFIWAAIGQVDQVTRAQAVLIATDRTQLVQSPDGGC